MQSPHWSVPGFVDHRVPSPAASPLSPNIAATLIHDISANAQALMGSIINIVDTAPTIPTGRYSLITTVPDAAATDFYNQLLGADITLNVTIGGTAAGAHELDEILDIFRWGARFAVTASFIAALFSLISLLHDRPISKRLPPNRSDDNERIILQTCQ